MATHIHTTTHPLPPLQRFAVGHPYPADWLLLTLGTLAALLLWLWNS